MTHENPLAYALGLEGIALMRAFTGTGELPGDPERAGHGPAFVAARVAEIRRLLDDASLAGAAVDVARVDTVEGYRIWSSTYDGPNTAFDYDEPVLAGISAALPPDSVVLDAACGTGRLAALAAGSGHRVVGVDSSPDMLAMARERVPEGDFRRGDLHALPVDDASADLVTCSLALTHVPELGPVLAEFGRVLRPGGLLFVADIHPEQVARGVIPSVRRADGSPARLASYVHRTGDYVRAALAAGLSVHRCDEPAPRPGPEAEDDGAAREPGPGPWEVWPWSLSDLAPEAADTAWAGMPAMVLWQFVRQAI
ncbi:class I SAM-dependent methyltransferase [Streptomyces sp. NPDC050400]|uniref:class I SAM-dependent methyltransferase n=1 Tax=Streptomyces sp. NPDC050400 TaxID=3365610 RepID=UPI003793E44D